MADYFDVVKQFQERRKSHLGGAPRTDTQTLIGVESAAKSTKENAARTALQLAQQLQSSMQNGRATLPYLNPSTRKAVSTATPRIGSPRNEGWGQQSGDPRSLAQRMAAERGWTGQEWDALVDLVQRESGWNPNAQNPTSTAYGLFQFLDSTRKNYGITRDASLQQQIDAGLRYIADRYRTPSGALAHWLARKPINGRDVGHWY